MTTAEEIGPRGRWFIHELAATTGLSEREAERALNELIERGHLRVLPNAGPNGHDGFELVIKDQP